MFYIPKWHVGLNLKFAFLNINVRDSLSLLLYYLETLVFPPLTLLWTPRPPTASTRKLGRTL